MGNKNFEGTRLPASEGWGAAFLGFEIFSIICDVEVVEGSTTRMALLTLSNIVFGIPFEGGGDDWTGGM